jgi:hypothetical protein
MVASYARDVLYTPTGDWRLVQRLSDLIDAIDASLGSRGARFSIFGRQLGGEL